MQIKLLFLSEIIVSFCMHACKVYEKGPYEENIYEEHIFFVRPLLEHDGVREGALRIKYIRTYFFVRPLLEHGVYEKVPCAHACARLSRLSFRALLTSG